uniref:ABC transporter ATP-binding protein n=1 Tax=Fervidobacterium thailandense TaxID=1008305 RepID=A0A7C4CFD8_9BACT
MSDGFLTIELKGVSKYLRTNGTMNSVLNGISCTFRGQEVVGLIGENGSGKSTLLKIIAALIKPDSGSIFYNNENIFRILRSYRSLVSYVSESISFINELTVAENLWYFSLMYKSTVRLDDVVEKVSLDSVASKRPVELSKGYRQRLAIAVGLLKDSKIFLLDEPAEGLDTETKQIVKRIVNELKSKGALVVYVTHDDDELEDVCDKIVMLKNGCVTFFGTVDDFWNKYGKFYRVVYQESGKGFKCNTILKGEELNETTKNHRILHIRPLGLREIVNFQIENGKEGAKVDS